MPDYPITLEDPRLRQTEEGHGYLQEPEVGPLEAFAKAQAQRRDREALNGAGMAGTRANYHPRVKTPEAKLTPEQLMMMANLLQAQKNAEYESMLKAPSAVAPTLYKLEHGQESNGYTTQLTPEGESAYQEWANKHAKNDSGEDYDYRGAFIAGMGRDQTGHLPDTYKKPNHPTFSEESSYSWKHPEGAGYWIGDQYVPAGTGK